MQRVLAATPDRLLVVDPADWTAAERLAGRDPQCVAATAEAALCGTFDDGLHRSTDGGESWERVDALADEAVTAVAVGPDGTAWAGTEPSAVYRSDDGGATWAPRPGLTDLDSADEWSFPPRPDTHHVRWLEPGPVDPDRLYVAVEAGALVRTDDGGETWRDRVPSGPIDTHTMATHPDDPGRAYSAAGDGYFETTDGGDSWRAREAGLDRTYCWSVAVDPADPDARLLSAARGPRAAHGAGGSAVFRRVAGDDERARDDRTDGGRWVPAMDGLPASGDLLAPLLEPASPGAFLALTNRGLFRTDDGGRRWESLPLRWPDDLRDDRPTGLAIV